MKKTDLILAGAFLMLISGVPAGMAQNPIHVTYLWHMHQPIYFPYESVQATDNANRFVFSVSGVHGERSGNYGDWPKNAVQQGADRGLPNAGVQVSFSGSLMENLGGLWGTGWREHWRWARNGLRTARNNPRLDLVGFAYHHSLMPLTSYESMRMQIKLHREAYKDNWNTGGTYSKGFFPPESSFASHMIPALVDEGIEWVMVDNGHFDRALEDFPWSPASSIRPNRSEMRNGTATGKGSQWVQLQNVWAPTRVAAPFSYQPHRVRYVDPNSSPENPSVKSMIAVPAARYEGNENGRGGYGAFKPENVWGSHVDKNNDPQRPMLILCHSDGDNFGMKNADAFHGQHGLFLNMIQSNPNFSHTTVQDYLDMYPVPANDFIHAEAGSWIGIDGGTPYYDKWVENNARDGQHPDYWSWSVVIAAQNHVLHADDLENNYSMNDVRWGIGPDTAKAWRYFLQSETSCHWYWDYDTANPWDGNATRAANLAVAEANKVIARHASVDRVGPAIFHPQRKIWNPGGKHWNETANQPSDFDVWTFASDVNGVASVTLKWRTADFNSYKNLNNYAHELYAHTPGQNSPWNSFPMTGDWYPSAKGSNVPDPAARAMRYTGRVQGASDTLVSYFIEAVDTRGNTNKSIILHVWVGESTGGGTNPVLSRVEFDPPAPSSCDPVTIKYRKSTSALGAGPIHIHIGRNGWQDTVTPSPLMTDSGDFWTYTYNTPTNTTVIDVVFNNGAGSWDNNSGADWHLPVTNCAGLPPPPGGFAITNPPSNLIVDPGTTQFGIQGIATGVVGHLSWSNSLTGGTGLIPATSSWTIPSVALGVGSNIITVRGTNAVTGSVITVAEDKVSNYSSWTNGANLGSGFGPWSLVASANAGSFTNATGFGLWSLTNHLSEAIRPFSTPLAAGHSFRATIKNGWVKETPSQGIGMALRDTNGVLLIQYFFNGGDQQYQIQDAAPARNSGIGWTDAMQTVEVSVVSANAYAMRVGATTITGNYNGVISQVRFWSWNGSAGSNYDFHFNHLRVNAPGPASVTSTGATVLIVRPSNANADSNGDGIPDAWYQAYGMNHLTPQLSSSNLPGSPLTYWEAYLLDINPTNPPVSNPLRISFEAAGMEGLRVEAPTSPHRRYDVYWTTSLTDNVWIPMGMNMPGNSNNGPIVLPITTGSDMRYYRTGVKLPNP